MPLPAILSRETFLWALDNPLFTAVVYGIVGAVIFNCIGKLSSRDPVRQMWVSKAAAVLGLVAGLALSTRGTIVDLAKNWLFLLMISVFLAALVWTFIDGFLENRHRAISVPLAILLGALTWFAFGITLRKRLSQDVAAIVGTMIVTAIALGVIFGAVFLLTRPRPARPPTPPRAPTPAPGAPPTPPTVPAVAAPPTRPPPAAHPTREEEIPLIEAEIVTPSSAELGPILNVLKNVEATAIVLERFEEPVKNLTEGREEVPMEARRNAFREVSSAGEQIKNLLSRTSTVLNSAANVNILRSTGTYDLFVRDYAKFNELFLAVQPDLLVKTHSLLKAVAYAARAQMYALHCAASLAGQTTLLDLILSIRSDLDKRTLEAEQAGPASNWGIAYLLKTTIGKKLLGICNSVRSSLALVPRDVGRL